MSRRTKKLITNLICIFLSMISVIVLVGALGDLGLLFAVLIGMTLCKFANDF